jgi:hypothetical protein
MSDTKCGYSLGSSEQARWLSEGTYRSVVIYSDLAWYDNPI